MCDCRFLNILQGICYVLLLIGGINWGLIGFFDFNLVGFLFGEGMLARIIYDIVGIVAIVSIVVSIICIIKNKKENVGF